MVLGKADFLSAQQVMNQEHIPIWHDVRNSYEPLETLIGELNSGCGFGELAMNLDGKDLDQRKRNYSAVALSNCIIV